MTRRDVQCPSCFPLGHLRGCNRVERNSRWPTMITNVAEKTVNCGIESARETTARVGASNGSGWWSLGLILLTGAVYANSLRAPYLYDDKYYFERDVSYRSIAGALANSPTRRVGVLTFVAEYRAHRWSPVGCHSLNVTIHALAGLVLFGFVRRTLNLPGTATALAERATTLSGIIAAVWLVHPIQTCAVTYVIQRFESLMGLWFLLALYGLARGATSTNSWLWYGLAAVADWLGVQTKEVMAVVPVVAVAYDRIFLSDSWREVLRRRGGLHAAFALCSGWAAYEIRWAFDPTFHASAGVGTPGLTSWIYLRSQGGVILHYLRLVFWPDRLALDYAWPIAQSAAEIYVPGAVILGLLAITGWALWRRPRWGFLGLTFFVILAPTSSVMPIKDLAFDHRMYLPLAAIVSLTVLGLASFIFRNDQTRRGVCYIALGTAILVVGALGTRTVVRNRDFSDAIRLWSSNNRAAPQNSRGFAQLGFGLLDKGRVVEAERQFQRAAELNPRAYWTLMGLGRVRFKQARFDEAAGYFERARRIAVSRAIACEYLARIEERHGRWPRAAEFYREAIEVDPNYEQVRLGLARVLLNQGESAECATVLRDALVRESRSRPVRQMLAELLATTSDASVRNGPEAVGLAEALASETDYRHAATLDILAAAYAAVGRFDRAIEAAERGLSLPADQTTRTRLKERLEKYRNAEAIATPFAPSAQRSANNEMESSTSISRGME